ncbi:DNA phosphorothioation-dependent restriction protein DptG [Sphingomonas sp. NFR04]|uniref:MarR family transcriptional regulator n=1 Tax=Sphingomonas sp. NFR04 TaxID=1566283 RepID=UPI0008E07ED5|nr:helix-turn-helix domain-containing protein [Sphingomonas sp. NFR04]SFJ51042.1 DNA phosphorothioation-dependent restriction protein DptG [Sphingomonas sp. NFR04]
MAAPSRLSPSDWATIVTLYERGEKNLRDLAEQFGVSKQAIQQGLHARGITKGSRLAEVTTEVEDVARAERERQVQQATETRDNYAKWTDAIAKMVMSKVINAGKNNGSVATANADVLTLKNAMAVIQKARVESWDILQIEDLLGEGASLPDLNVGEYSESELDAIREGNEASYLEGLEDEDEEGSDDSLDD